VTRSTGLGTTKQFQVLHGARYLIFLEQMDQTVGVLMCVLFLLANRADSTRVIANARLNSHYSSHHAFVEAKLETWQTALDHGITRVSFRHLAGIMPSVSVRMCSDENWWDTLIRDMFKPPCFKN
jgi:hypothetical protein